MNCVCSHPKTVMPEKVAEGQGTLELGWQWCTDFVSSGGVHRKSLSEPPALGLGDVQWAWKKQCN